ncbi:sensor histidine kinase [Methanoregula sp.]|uniref:sensor histidine kinase n=1 Tax=Methanoregula sp. TaxID=2052170 RepID=UPI002B9AE5E4|nr:ATP-binding protein [Methanoregula sp.]HVP97589.1 ATP-binding protein [Methanoregula sp.]
MSRSQEPEGLYRMLAMVFAAMVVLMFFFELAKQTLNPDITLWESHGVTIVFTSALSVVLVFFPLRSAYHERQKTKEELRLRQEAEENLRRSEMQYRSFVESVEDSIYTVDRETRYLLINTRHLVRSGLSPQAYAGKKYADFHSPAETRLFEKGIETVLATKRPFQDEYEKDGGYFLRKFYPVIDPERNEVVAVTIISSDITDRKNAEKHIETVNRKLNLLNDITRHDILNQLTVLHSLLDLADEQSTDMSAKKYLARGEQVIDTIHAQIAFSYDYQTIGVKSPQWQDLTQTVQRARMPLKIGDVILDASCSNLEIYADPLLEKVFFNLFENSLRYAGAHPRIRLAAEKKDGYLLLTYEDNGPGVPDEEKEKVFLRGFGKNTGLGLFLIRDILAITGITISENGTAGKGARFEIAVPAGAYRYR